MVPVPKCPAPKRQRRIGGAESAAPKRTRPVAVGSVYIYKFICWVNRILCRYKCYQKIIEELGNFVDRGTYLGYIGSCPFLDYLINILQKSYQLTLIIFISWFVELIIVITWFYLHFNESVVFLRSFVNFVSSRKRQCRLSW